MADRIGQQLGNYRLIRLLGRGGFAEVYLGEHVHLGTQAAIKVLTTRLASSEEVEQFRQESRTIAHLEHPHIVRVFDFDVKEDIPFLVMHYAPHGTLRQRHSKGSIVPLPTIITYVKQISDALQYAHDQNIIHRDVKPENMLLSRREELLLSDFGIATFAHNSHSQSTEDIVGTMAYMSPEQIQGKPRPASDQYSLGIVVYEWLSGDRPFHGSLTEIIAQQLTAYPPSFHEKVPSVSSNVELVVLTALAKDPKQRFNSVKAFAVALEQAAQPSPLPVSASITSTDVAMPASHLSQTGKVISPSYPQEGSPAVQREAESVQPPVKPRITRRMVVVGLAGLAVAGGAWLALSQGRHISLVADQTPTVLPLETTLLTYRGHSAVVWSVAWSPNSKRIASGGDDKTVQVWDASTGTSILTYHGHSNSVIEVAWSPDGTRIASGSDDKTVQVWDASTGAKLLTYRGHASYVWSVAWSPDGTRIASGSDDNTVQVWDASTGANLLIYQGHTSYVWSAAWSPDGKHIASGSGDKTAQMWDASTGANLLTYRGHSDYVHTVAWSPDGRHIASGGGDKAVQVWDASTGTTILTYRGHSDGVLSVAWSPSGKHIASGSYDNTVQVWDASTGTILLTYRGHSVSVYAVAWSPNGGRIASGSRDNTVQVWSTVDF